ncbi:MAG: sensor histidine kinase N-terminal domain-containing protein [Proteobacteria bacterium]|nr:sensor histidine kinase N-terminal domain-containing protein [Pseudomonadota bacterium]
MRAASATLRGQLLRWLLIPLCLLFVVVVATSVLLAGRLSDRVNDSELVEIARELALHVRAADGHVGFDLAPDAERTLLLDPFDTLRYAVFDATGARIAGDAELALPPAGAPFHDARVGGAAVRVARYATRVDGTPVAIAVASTRHGNDALARDIVAGVVLPSLALILIAGALVAWGVRRGLAPLDPLRHAVAARSHRDLSPVPTAGVPAEVRPLVAAINDLLARLDEVLGVQNRFIADAAHEMRTPVAGMKAHIELALREEDPARVKASLAHLYVSVERMTRLVGQLLALARNEPTTVKALELAPLDLAQVAFDVTTEWVPHAYRHGIDLGFEGAGRHVTIAGDAGRLTELLNNLIDNAIRYSREGGRVTVRVLTTPTPRVSVSDDGPTIPVAERERVFERFHRLLGTRADGSGLGLAIVREIASLHGATIRLEDDVDGVGNTFTIEFPGPL